MSEHACRGFWNYQIPHGNADEVAKLFAPLLAYATTLPGVAVFGKY